MLRQAERFSLSLPIELSAAGYRRSAAVQDLSRSGMFVQVEALLPVGAELRVTMAPEGRRLTTVARVVHALAPADAAAAGRAAGMGLAFRAPEEAADHLFAIGVERLLREHHASALEPTLRVLVADGDLAAVAARARGLRAAGMAVTTATSGLELLAACRRGSPDLIVVARDLPVIDGLAVLAALARRPELAMIPAIVTSPAAEDIDAAFALGAADFVTTEVTPAELAARIRRHAIARLAPRDAAVLRGDLATVGLPAVLTMLEQERATGRLEIAGAQGGWIELVGGVITGAGSTHGARGQAAVLALLDEARGTYALWPGGSSARPELSLPVRFALLEHARVRDEASRGASRPAGLALVPPLARGSRAHLA